jgi:hypothetical protein
LGLSAERSGPTAKDPARPVGSNMNIQKLKEAEAAFLARFPDGFADPGLEKIRISHNVDRLADFTRLHVTDATLSRPGKFIEVLLTIVSRSSMVSRFEKPPFREFLSALSSNQQRDLADAYRQRLFGKKRREGFEAIVELFSRYKLGRWSLVSAVPFYFAPSKEVFVKPTTAKKIVTLLDVEGLHYHPRPNWTFYTAYRKLILDIGEQVDPSLTPHNAATTGFLMATL